jgi:hypothetical protein
MLEKNTIAKSQMIDPVQSSSFCEVGNSILQMMKHRKHFLYLLLFSGTENWYHFSLFDETTREDMLACLRRLLILEGQSLKIDTGLFMLSLFSLCEFW